jgi:uncharacterized protein YbbK (DUF523 family)
MKKLIISACLLGERCRYDGKCKKDMRTDSLAKRYELIPVCPEVMGGLSVPRAPSEIIGERVINRDGVDVTDNYRLGAERTLAIAKESGAEIALLKERSPSCGKGKIYDGSFSGTLKDGDGITVRLLTKEGIAVYGESEIEQL